MDRLLTGIIVAIGFTAAIILLVIYNVQQESQLEESQLQESKAWVETLPFSCLGYGCYISWLNAYDEIFSPTYSRVNILGPYFENATKIIKVHFRTQDITIHDAKMEGVHISNCEFGECQEIWKLKLLVSEQDVDTMIELGFVRVTDAS